MSAAFVQAATLTLATGLGLTHAGNLVQNGSFETQASGSTMFFWITGTANAPYEPLDDWSSLGGASAYGQRADTYSTYSSAPVPDGTYALYFGNQFCSSISETPTFLANGRVQFTSAPTIAPKGVGYVPAVQLSQTISGLNPTHAYGLSFWASGEGAQGPQGGPAFGHDGILGLDVTGFDTEYLAAPAGVTGGLGVSHVYEFTFVPGGSSVTVKFTNWGHYGDGGLTTGWTLPYTSELVLDDVIINDLGPVPEPATISVLLGAAGLMVRRGRKRRMAA